MDEVWKAIPGFPGYEASNLGQVRSLRRETPRILSPYCSPGGYSGVGLYRDGKTVRAKVHQLVMLAFVGSAPNGTEVCHNDDDRNNNRLDNLRYDTHLANMQDCVKNGKRPLPTKQVHQVKRRRYILSTTQSELTEMTYINFYAPQDLRTTLEEQAAKEGRSLSNFICRFLEEHLVQAIPGPAETTKNTKEQPVMAEVA